MTVGQAVEDWFASFQAKVATGEKSPGTARKYRDVIDAYIAPRLGLLPLRDVNAEVLEPAYAGRLRFVPVSASATPLVLPAPKFMTGT